MLLAVIGLVSFGIYISARIPPPVRFAEVALGAFALTIAGWRLERRMPGSGKVLFGGGLGAIYLVSLAGYAFAPMRVFTTPLAGTLAQFGAAALVIALASLRRSEKLATLGVFFGFAAAWFAIYAGLGTAALSAGVGLLALAAVAWLAMGWRVPLLLATPLALLMPVLVAHFVWRPNHVTRVRADPRLPRADLRCDRRARFPPPRPRRMTPPRWNGAGCCSARRRSRCSWRGF